ncbi:ester cyclase [Maliponia aquimaris]|uniref:SnoaL-like domain protein n=1 Tax=Maliponia aquimaris TaxID=1673631 RepID=A0A238KGA8_9RHOB|nr:ester cyclase [Maliponia aquimaris]SMX41056.1 SnoaL-like domain protein [Maliponia aquimaris]
MTSFQAEKDLVRQFHAALDAAAPADLEPVATRFATDDWLWRGFHPFGELRGSGAVASAFWSPLRQSLTRMQRRVDIFMAGRNELDGFASVWVVSMGHLMGLFDRPWLGIAPTGKMAFLRYCEFNRVENGRIAETAMYFDIPHLMMQTGLTPFPPQTAAHLVQPGPLTHDGLLFGPQPEAEGAATLAAINAMIGDLGTWQLGLPLEEELARTWHDDMIWWGPAGIGATYTIERYAKQHSAPFRAAFTDRSKTRHICRMAEGHYGGFFGWPNFTARHKGGFMGMPGSDTPGEMRVIDIYRRSGDKLAENWIFIDLLHFWKTQGVDILARMQAVPRT